jgi:hypothetical protein
VPIRFDLSSSARSSSGGCLPAAGAIGSDSDIDGTQAKLKFASPTSHGVFGGFELARAVGLGALARAYGAF